MSERILGDVESIARPTLTVVNGEAGVDSADLDARESATDALATALIDAFGDRVLFLFDRRIPGVSGELPVIAVSSGGVHLFEPRSYPGKRIRACEDGSAFVIDGVRHQRIADQMLDHVEALQATIATGPLPEAMVHSAYCFVAGDLPRRRLRVAGVRALSVRAVVRRLRSSGPLSEREVEAVHRDLSRRLLRAS